MRINEDFIEQEDIIDDITDTDIIDENPYYIMQDRRPVKELLKDWDCIFFIEIGDYWTKVPDYVKRVEEMVNIYTRQLTDMIGRLPYGVEMSKFVVGSGLNDGEFEHEDTEFSTYKEYLLNQTDDDNGIQKETKLFLGISLNQKTLNIQKAFVALSKISNIIFRITKAKEFTILYKKNNTFESNWVFNSATGVDDMRTRLEKDIDSNYAGRITKWTDILCVLAGHDNCADSVEE